MRIVFIGSGSFGIPALQLLTQDHTLVGVFCSPPRPAGRKMALTSCPLAVAARRLSLPLNEIAPTEKMMQDLQPQAIVVCDYGTILSPSLWQNVERGAINIHSSLLPQWRGAAPIIRAIINGDADTGITIMQMDAGLDSGDILLQAKTPILPTQNGGELFDLLADMGAKLLLQVLHDNPPPLSQDATAATYAAKITSAERALDFNQPAALLVRQIRAFAPTPGAHAYFSNGERIKILSAEVLSSTDDTPGKILSADKNGIVVACGQQSLNLLQLQRAGRRQLAAAEFVRGTHLPDSFQLPPV
ncbi:MAG: methionyl-tRNA formyltransferase [Gammaproteobacteria bacterium WSBS_2016_MAG_OTU1]